MSAGPLHIAIPSEVSVQSDVILLRDLLPAAAPRELQSLAASIDLGAAPRVGALRSLASDFILAAIDSADLPAASFSVPAFVTVRRASRRVTRDDVLAAIEIAIGRDASLSSVDLSTVAFDASVDLPDRDPQLAVTEAIPDVALHRVRFRLVARAAPSALPFSATARLVSYSAYPPAQLARSRSRDVETLISSAKPVLVSGDRPARLHIQSGNSDLSLVVKPLQRGRFGEIIRVQLLGTQKILRGRVVAPGQLEASF